MSPVSTTTTPVPGNSYVFTNLRSWGALDASLSDGESVISYQFWEGQNQKWTLLSTGNQNGWFLQPLSDKTKYLGIKGTPDDLVAENTPVIISGTQFEWSLILSSTGDQSWRIGYKGLVATVSNQTPPSGGGPAITLTTPSSTGINEQKWSMSDTQ